MLLIITIKYVLIWFVTCLNRISLSICTLQISFIHVLLQCDPNTIAIQPTSLECIVAAVRRRIPGMSVVSTQGQLPLMLPVDILLSSSLLWYPSLSHSPIGIYFWWSSGRTLIYKLGLWIKGHQLRTRCWNHIRRVCRTGFPVSLQLSLRTEPLFVDEPSFKWKKCRYLPTFVSQESCD